MKPNFCFSLVLLASMLGVWGCQTSNQVVSEQSPTLPSSADDNSTVRYSLVYMIHGDANYLYHNEAGESRRADVQKMKEAMKVARRAKQGEVFIFHQRPEEKVLWIFPKKDRYFLHYRNGKLLHRQRYSPGSDSESFVAEKKLFQRYKSDHSMSQLFLYFGHEIPHQSGINYHRSRSHSKFDTNIFSRGMRSFLKEGTRFDLTVLSTCENGTPLMVSSLQPITRYLLASPQNLHLSHIDSEPLLRLQENPDMPTKALADSLAHSTYDRLSAFLQTSITLSVYETDTVGDFLGSINEKYRDLTAKPEKENVDCATFDFWNQQAASDGVTVLYKRPSFGRKANHASYSGWGCQPDLFE